MTIQNALHNGVTGLSANSSGLSVISNNIANANTKSYKGERVEFEDMFAENGDGPSSGRGAQTGKITTNFSQGALTSTGQVTDLGIQGEGFFVVKSKESKLNDASGGLQYTRQGSFRFDSDGHLVTTNGERVQGYMPDPANPDKLAVRTSDINISSSMIPPQATSVLNVVANLDVRAKPPTEDFNPAKANETANFSTPVTIYDTLGKARQATIHYVRDKDPGKNSWQWFVTVAGSDVSKSPQKDENGKEIPALIGKGKIEFDNNGKPVFPFQSKFGEPVGIDTTGKKDAFSVQFADGAQAQKIQLNFGSPLDEQGRPTSAQGTTSVAARSEVSFQSQDGIEAGYIKSLKIEKDGVIKGTYSNGVEKRLGAIAMASFQNNQGLVRAGQNNFTATVDSGEPRIGFAQTGTRGSIFSSSLEESNVDLAQQFVDMISTQRGFQANSKSVTTADAMLEEIISWKR